MGSVIICLTEGKSPFTIDDENTSDTDFSNDKANMSCTSSSSSDDFSDNDTDNTNTKPKIRKHQKQTVCPEINCFKSFLTAKGLQTHVNLHGKFPCQFCDKSISYAPGLAYHENLMHTDLVNIKQRSWISGSVKQNKFKFKFSRCPQNFWHKLTFMHHFVKKHLGLSIIHSICLICQYPSHTESLSYRNLILHFTPGMESSNIPRFNQCPAYFRLNSRLAHRKLKVHNEKLSCQICGIVFKWKGIYFKRFTK